MIEIWSKPNCIFCDKAEMLCKMKSLEYKKYMLDVDYTREDFVNKFPEARTFPQIKYFKHGWRILSGRYVKEDTQGETTPFRALTTALSGTVGTGNIGGVALAIFLGVQQLSFGCGLQLSSE